MKKIKLTQLRQNLFRVADEVVDKQVEIVLTRRGKRDLVLVSQADWLRVKEKAQKYEAQNKRKRKSMVGSLVLRTKDLETDIRKIRDEFARSLSKDPEARQ